MEDGYGFDALIEALTIFRRYAPGQKWPTSCSHDEMAIMGVGEVSAEDAARLDVLGFIFNDNEDYWLSFRFGSA
jgi:hypothetical protein